MGFSQPSFFLSLFLPLIAFAFAIASGICDEDNTSFNENYEVSWGFNHAVILDQGREIQLSMDYYSGAGFLSKLSYGSGFFSMRIKVPDKDTAGVVTAFYLTSQGANHDELDFEFLGNRPGKPITLQTNVFANGVGNREERVKLWFDPSADFHNYEILWNPQQIVFFVDDIPIRVFKNNTKIGVSYPSQPMQVQASLWNGDSWATDGGKAKINWSFAPFIASFQGFKVDGCPFNTQQCNSMNFWWNSKKYWALDSIQQSAYEEVRQKYMNYDYCTDRNRYPTPPPECSH